MTDTTTLLRSLSESVLRAWYRYDNEVSLLQSTVIAQDVAETLLAEIERRCAERGYATLIGLDDHATWGTSITDFIAELRGEIQDGN